MYTFPEAGGDIGTQALLASKATGRNGNWLSYALGDNDALTIKDSLGRTLVTTTGFQPSQAYSSLTDTITAAGAGYAVVWKGEDDPAQAVSISGAGAAPCPNETTNTGGNSPVITSMTTPEGTYTFAYNDPYGLVSQVNDPNGGYVRYSWAVPSQPTEAGAFDTPPEAGVAPETCTGVYALPVITDRYVSPDGVHETEHQHFDYWTSWNTGSANDTWHQKSTQVTTTDTSSGASYQTSHFYTPVGAPGAANTHAILASQTPVESEVEVGQGSGTLQDVVEQWTSSYPPQLTDRQTRRDWVAIAEQCFRYNAADQIVDKQEFTSLPGCGKGASPARETTVSYASFSGKNIVDRPASVTIYGSGGAMASQSNYGYNGNGDLVSSARWVSGTTYLTTTYAVDSYGNRTGMTDAAGNTTAYAYGGSGDNAYVASITDALGHERSFTWNDSAGTMASAIGENGHTTSYGYDGWNRLTEVSYPDGGETAFAYTPSTLETKREQSSGVWQDALESFDGLGRAAVEATEVSGGEWSRVDTCYNGFGEKSFVSYPYLSTGSGGAPDCSEGGASACSGYGCFRARRAQREIRAIPISDRAR
ncbi:MAG: hypothetical protein ACRD0Y_05835, partial [Terriglobales bacterium]